MFAMIQGLYKIGERIQKLIHFCLLLFVHMRPRPIRSRAVFKFRLRRSLLCFAMERVEVLKDARSMVSGWAKPFKCPLTEDTDVLAQALKYRICHKQ